jgi:hypothetical protein
MYFQSERKRQVTLTSLTSKLLSGQYVSLFCLDQAQSRENIQKNFK